MAAKKISHLKSLKILPDLKKKKKSQLILEYKSKKVI